MKRFLALAALLPVIGCAPAYVASRPGAPVFVDRGGPVLVQTPPQYRADRREDVRDRREDVRDRREDVRDRREDVRDSQRYTGPADVREDRRDRAEDRRDRAEDIRDRREDRRDRWN